MGVQTRPLESKQGAPRQYAGGVCSQLAGASPSFDSSIKTGKEFAAESTPSAEAAALIGIPRGTEQIQYE